MAQSWIEVAGKLALFFFFTGIAAGIALLTLRSVAVHSRRGNTHPGDGALEAGGTSRQRLDRFFLEYVGNACMDDLRSQARPAGFVERRTNQPARALMRRIEQEMRKHGVPPGERDAVMEGLRRSVRLEASLQEVSSHGLQEASRVMQQERSGLARTIRTLVADLPPELIARIETGSLLSPGTGDELDEQP